MNQEVKPKTRVFKVMLLTILIVIGLGFVAFKVLPIVMLSSIGKSHVDANVPGEKVFDEYLKRDLEVYFIEAFEQNVTVEYELLRDGPTQAGIAFPKYYAWTHVVLDDDTVEYGAVRMAAIDQEEFSVTHYINKEQIINNSESLESIFPSDVVDKIKKRL